VFTHNFVLVYSRRGFRTQRSSIGIGQIDLTKEQTKAADAGSKMEANAELMEKLRKEANEKGANHQSLIEVCRFDYISFQYKLL
jgi:hypothetical protein